MAASPKQTNHSQLRTVLHQDRSPASAEGNRTTGPEKVEEYQDEIQAGAALESIARAMRQRGYDDL